MASVETLHCIAILPQVFVCPNECVKEQQGGLLARLRELVEYILDQDPTDRKSVV